MNVIERLLHLITDPNIAYLLLSLGTLFLLAELAELAVAPERLVAIGRELYAWHPRGVARSKLWTRLADRRLGVPATARNWTTVTKLLELAEG